MKKKKLYKVGIDSETFAISLVENPAIEETLVALEEQKEMKVQLANEEKYMVYSAVLVPDKPIYRRSEDGDEYYIEFTKESIEKMSQEFLQNYRQNEITLDHETQANDITLVESWIKESLTLDKSVAIGLSAELPVGTWIAGLKVNQIDVWNRIKNGELRGFSVESLISLEEFNNQNKDTNNMDKIETNEMFWNKLKNTFKELLGLIPEAEFENETVETEMEEQEPVVEPEPVAEPTPEPEPVQEPEPTPEPEPEPVVEPEPTPEPQDNHFEELINNLRAEIEALKANNNALEEQVKELGKKPSANPINTNAKPSTGDTYQQWRDVMRQMIG